MPAFGKGVGGGRGGTRRLLFFGLRVVAQAARADAAHVVVVVVARHGFSSDARARAWRREKKSGGWVGKMTPEGRLVFPVTVVVHKPRYSTIGIRLQHGEGMLQHPVIVGSADERFRVGDAVYVVNGRVARGARSTAWRIRRKAWLSITLLRSGSGGETDTFVF